MKTLRQFLQENEFSLSKIVIKTSDSIIDGSKLTSFSQLEHLMDNELYDYPRLSMKTGILLLFVQD